VCMPRLDVGRRRRDRRPLFPYTTLFRSGIVQPVDRGNRDPLRGCAQGRDEGSPSLLRPPATAESGRGDHADQGLLTVVEGDERRDRKSTRLNSSHVSISYAVFCLKKNKL